MDNSAITAMEHLARAVEELEREQSRLLKRIEKVRSDIRAIHDIMLSNHDRSPSSVSSREAAFVTNELRMLRELQGVTYLDALIHLAQSGDGTVRSSEAARILVEAGVISGNPTNAPSSIHRLLRNSDRFEPESPGVFRLVSKDQDRASVKERERIFSHVVFTNEEDQEADQDVTPRRVSRAWLESTGSSN